MTLAIERLVAAWCEHDHVRALLPVDHEIIDATSGIRALIVESLSAAMSVEPRPADKDLFHACLVLGRLIAEAGGSPTLAACTLDGAQAVLRLPDAPWPSARAAIAEGFAAAQTDHAKHEASVAWDYPRCVARIDASTAAVVAGFPEDDGAVVAAWADRVASGILGAGIRRAVVSGREAPRNAVTASLSAAGIEIVDAETESGARARPSRWWLPWRRA